MELQEEEWNYMNEYLLIALTLEVRDIQTTSEEYS